jgi:hypothetical protein
MTHPSITNCSAYHLIISTDNWIVISYLYSDKVSDKVSDKYKSKHYVSLTSLLLKLHSAPPAASEIRARHPLAALRAATVPHQSPVDEQPKRRQHPQHSNIHRYQRT